MAGIGVRLNRIFSKNTITTNIIGFLYSISISIAPMIFIIGAVMLMQIILGFASLNYATRELYSSTILYIFIFSLMFTAPYNAVLSRCLADAIYNETFDDIIACYYVGAVLNVVTAMIPAIPFCIRAYYVGFIPVYYIFTAFCGYMALVLVFHSMLFLTISKDYRKISLFYFIGMAFCVLLSVVFVRFLNLEITYSMLLSLAIGFLITGSLEYAQIKSYYRENSGRYALVFAYLRDYWMLMVSNTLYICGLYAHNFVFWTTDLKMEVANVFVSAPSYDLATCIAMFTNFSASVIFIARVEMNFRDRYRLYSEAVIGGRFMDIEISKRRMFSQLSEELMNLVRIQFIISVALFLIAITFLPRFGMGGLTMRIYPALAAGYFILMIMYSAIIFLYYFNDLVGSVITALSFFIVSVGASFFSAGLPDYLYGMGFFAGAFTGWCVAYFRLRYIEKNMYIHVFCQGSIMKPGIGKPPSNLVFNRYETIAAEKDNRSKKEKKKRKKRKVRK